MSKNNSNTLLKLRRDADKGVAQAQYELGYAYMNGSQIEQDDAKGFNYLEKAAIQNHPEACLELGLAYQNGKGTNKNLPKAMAYLKRSAALGDTRSYSLIFSLYLNEEYKKADENEAAIWLRKGAEAGDRLCQYLFSRAYLFGLFGLPFNETLSAMWCRKSAHNGHLDAIIETAEKYETGTGVRKSPERVFYWRKKAADLGHMESQYKIGKTYWFGEGVKQNVRLAKTYMHDAMEQGYAYALNAYGVMCLHDKEPEIQQTAISYFKQAVRRGFDGALVNLGELYYRGSIVNQDYGKAFEYFSQASESTSQDVKYVSDVFLAFMYYDGTGKENNEVDAMTFWQQNKLAKIPEIQSFLPDVNTLISERKSKFIADARTGDASSKHELAMLLETGTMGFKRDSERAAFWYCKAADKGFVYAFNCAASYYADGKGVEKDLAKALRLYVAGISGGDKSASMNLAAMLWKGKKVPKNIRYAYSLYISALNSENGIPQAQDYIGRMLKELKKKDRKNFLKKKIFPVSHVLKKIEKFAQNLEKKIEQKSRKNFDKIDNCEISTM